MQGKWGFFDSKCPFLGHWEMGVFLAPTPSFAGFGDFDPHAQTTPPYSKHYGIVNYYAVVFYYALPYLVCCEPLFAWKNACKTQENGVSAGWAAIGQTKLPSLVLPKHSWNTDRPALGSGRPFKAA